MSDIDLRNLDWILEAFGIGCFLAPPLVIGLLALLLRIFVRQKNVILWLYFILSILAEIGVLSGLLIWLDLPAYAVWMYPLSIASPFLVFGFYAGFRRIRGIRTSANVSTKTLSL